MFAPAPNIKNSALLTQSHLVVQINLKAAPAEKQSTGAPGGDMAGQTTRNDVVSLSDLCIEKPRT